MDTNLFRRVYINGDPERLPKEDGVYFVAKKNLNKTSGLKPLIYTSISRKQWLNEVEYYLSPVPREEIIKIMRGLKNYMIDIAHGDDDACYVISDKGFETVADEIIGGVK